MLEATARRLVLAAVLGLLLPVRGSACTGDCDGDHAVTIGELIFAVNIVLGTAPLAGCPRLDRDGDGSAAIPELIAAVVAALDGCPPAAPTPPPTSPGSGPTVSPTSPAPPTHPHTPSPTPSAPPTGTAAETPSATPSVSPTPTADGGGPVFSDVTTAAGLTYVHSVATPRVCTVPRDPTPNEVASFIVDCFIVPQSAGAAAADFDGDGWIDLYVTRIAAPGLLFRNRGDGTFEDVTAAAGLAEPRGSANGAAWGDVDQDGDPDLYVMSIGGRRNHLWINDGQGRFSEQAVERGAGVVSDEPHFGMSATFGDYDRDGYLDLYATEWRYYTFTTPPVPSHSRLLRNRGAAAPGFFTDVTDVAGVRLDDLFSFGVFSFAPAFVDLDRDGWDDLAIIGDNRTSSLFWNDQDGTFSEDSRPAGVATSAAEMGSTFADYDGDGDLDWFTSAISCVPPYDRDPLDLLPGVECSGNRLYRNDGGRRFTDQTDALGVRVGHWGWGAAFMDYDNDGDPDLVMTNGIDEPEPVEEDEAYHDDPMRFWRNTGAGPWPEISAAIGLTDRRLGKGLLVFDYDRDGDLDILIANSGDRPTLYRNDGGNAADWLRVRVVGRRTNREGYGAWVSVTPTAGARAQVREIGVGTHFLGQSELVAHFGLGHGAGSVHEVRVEFPASGRNVTLTGVPANQSLEVVEPDD